jgi:hypothetical protein
MSQRQLKPCSRLFPTLTKPPSIHLLFAAAQIHPAIEPLTGLDEPGGQGLIFPPALRAGGPPTTFGAKTSL